MTRAVDRRLRVEGELVAEGPLHVGSGAGEPGVDLALARDGQGRLYVPGTGLAGALRAWCQHAFGDERVREVWGYQDPSTDDAPGRGSASLVTIEDAAVLSGEVAVRDGVGIDRRHGAAAEDHLYQRLVLLPGATFELSIGVDSPPGTGDRAVAAVAHLVGALEGGRVRLGASRSAGLGRVRLRGTRAWFERFDGPSGLCAALERRLFGTGDDRGELDAAARALEPRPDRIVRITVDWRAIGPLMVASGAAGIGVAVLPAVARRADELALLLPGTSIKGALRTRAEQIVRTLLPHFPDRHELRSQVDVPLVDWLFGWAPEGSGRGGDRPPRPDPAKLDRGLAALRVDDCLSRRGMDPARWDDLLSAERAEDAQRVLDSAARGWEAATHVALDPWTSGPVPGALYTAIEPHPGGAEWSAIELEVDLDRLRDDLARPALALLLLVLDDMARGEVPLGFGVNRGYGAVEVARATITGARELGLEETEPLTPGGSGGGLLAGSRAHGALLPAWSGWLEEAAR